jgi:hypothetical protein
VAESDVIAVAASAVTVGNEAVSVVNELSGVE